MSLKNTNTKYGSVAKWIHWLTALLFLAAYATVYFRHWFTEEKTPANWTALQLHLSVGVSLAVLVILRLIWRFMQQQPSPEPGTAMEHVAAKSGHFALYFIMIMMPLTGYLGTGANTEFFFLFDIPKFADTAIYQSIIVDGLGTTFEQIEPAIDFIHKDIGGQWLVWLLILGHAGAAFYHHHVKKDQTLMKMI